MAGDLIKKNILIVDDDAAIRESLKIILSRSYNVTTAEDGEEAISLLGCRGGGKAEQKEIPDLVILDVMMPGVDGVGVLEKIKADYPGLPVIMLTATTGIRTAVQAMKIGAVDYLSKPYDVDELISLIDETIQSGPVGRMAPTMTTVHKIHNESINITIPGDFGGIVGSHAVMRDLYNKIEQVAPRDTTLLITGESGVGKEVVAREIHRRSSRVNGPFVAINCAAIPESLIESELFGHEKGAFTHAVEKRIGHFELADGGTLFLDEIGELSLQVQVKMLRFLQEKEFYRVGHSKPVRVDVRVIAATNKSLENAIKDGRFRQDLYYRINVVAIEVPPLRKRKDDIPSLIDHFIKKMSPLYSNKQVEFSKDAIDLLVKNSWPGNVRELENVTESILALTNCEKIEVDDLPVRFRKNEEEDCNIDCVSKGSLQFEEAERLFEKELILKALARSNYVQTKAAELLGISRRILKYKMDKLGIEYPDQ